MGCVSGQEGKPKMGINNQIKKMQLQIDVKTKRIRQEAMKQQEILVSEFKKAKFNRVKAAEHTIAEQITIMINTIHVYEVTKEQLQKLSAYINHYDEPDKAKQTLFPAFRVIFYAESILNDPEVTSLCQRVRSKYSKSKYGLTEATTQEIESQIMRHHKNNTFPSQSMINDYILALCPQEGLKLEDINVVGHSFKFGA